VFIFNAGPWTIYYLGPRDVGKSLNGNHHTVRKSLTLLIYRHSNAGNIKRPLGTLSCPC
jgi:hypothetical protein